MADKRPALGRGLSALIPDATASPQAPRETTSEVDLDLLGPNPFQPRLNFDEGRLEELAASIRSNGIIQPILVRRRDRRYEIIAGERRWRAAQRAGLLKVPVVVREVPDDKLLEVALIENIQRENLNPIDEAIAYRRLIDEFKLTQESLATAVGKERSTIANTLRLLRLPDAARTHVITGALTMGHARALLGLENPDTLTHTADSVIAKGLSVRETEALVKKINAAPAQGENTHPPTEPQTDVHTRQAEDKLRFALGTRVKIRRQGKKGKIEIEFTSEDELQRLYEQLMNN